MEDPDVKKYSPPHSALSLQTKDSLSCTGKHIADCVESLIGAIYMSCGLMDAFKFISRLKIVPMEELGLI